MNLSVLIDINVSLIFVAIAAFVYHRRPPTPLWPTLFVVQLMAILWFAGDLGTLLAEDMFVEQISIGLVYGGSFGMFASWWILAFRFAETHGVRPTWATPRVIWAPVGFALFTWLCAVTNPMHGQFLTPVIGARNEYHWLWWATAPIGYGLMASIAVGYQWLDKQLDHDPNARKQCRTMLVATLLGLVSNAAYTLLPIDWPFDISIVGGLITGLIFVYGIYRGTLFDLSPAALQHLFNSDPTAQLIVNRQGRLLHANARAHALFERVGLLPRCVVEDQLRRVLREANSSHDRLSIERIWAQIDQHDYAGAFQMCAADGTKTQLWVTGQGVGGVGSKSEALSIRIHDITRVYDLEANNRKMEDRLAQTDRLRSLGSMAAGMAHEVNNPVGSALMAADFARLVISESSDLVEIKSIALDALRTVVEQSKRAGRVTRGMLRFARDGRGERSEGDLRQVVGRAIDFTREDARQHGAIVDFDSMDVPAVAEFNETEMEQVFVNLIHNAILSGKPGRHVNVAMERIDGVVRVTVQDDGAGLSAIQLERAFEPFYSSRSETTGTGLGLSVVHGIVTDHGGEVWLESEVGLGARAFVELPTTTRRSS